MDDDGFGMTDDEEIEIYGFIDTKGKVLVKFKAIKDRKELETMRKEAEEISPMGLLKAGEAVFIACFKGLAKAWILAQLKNV